LSEPYKVSGQPVLLSASVGIALSPANGTSVDELLTNADKALYYAKATGRNTHLLYEPEMDIRTTEVRLLEEDLRVALGHKELLIFYQPIFDTTTCKPIGLEALVRWHHPTRGHVSPESFIPVAEDFGLIVALDQWVMETACSEALRWPELRVAVNLSPKHFLESDLVASITSTLARVGLAPERFTVEITERVLIDNSERALSVLAALRQQGIRVSLDDFGTGYSSLGYLRQLPLDGIKIDKSFVKALSEDSSSQAIVQAILTLARNLSLTVVAEGVETQAQIEWLRAAGCPQVQGYLLGRPAVAEAIDEFLENS
jgi:predicted signal transduction protein with EAL and GGDEF domain